MASAQGGGGGGGGGQQGDNAYYILWVLALIFAAGFLIWYFFDVYLKMAFLAVKRYELFALYYALEWIPTTAPFGKQISHWVAEIKGTLDLVSIVNPKSLGAEVSGLVSVTTGQFLRWPISIYFILVAIITYRMSVQLRLKRKFNMKTLALQERVNWPQIDIATRYDILNEDLDVGPWAMNMSPVQFCRRFKLTSIEYNKDIPIGVPKSQIPEFKITLIKTRAERAFAAQLGRPWISFESMPPHRQAVLAALAARGGRDTKASQNLIAQLARTSSLGKLDCSGATELWTKHHKNKRVQEIIQRHAYEYTIFVSMLLFAREDGVQASSDFLWIKPIDRRLWFTINSVGRQTPSVEVGGVFSHWNYEKVLDKPLSVPMVMDAVLALELSLTEIIYIPDDKERDELKKRTESSGESVPETAEGAQTA